LSVIIPAYNSASTLAEQLDALKNQMYDGDWEIIVVNNRSTDDTVSVVEEYRRMMPHLRLVHAPEWPSASYARNVGAQSARGDAFLFCDADDVVGPGWLAALAGALEEHDLVAGVLDALGAPGQSSPRLSRIRDFSASPHLDFLPFAIGGNCAISREAFEAVGCFSLDFPRNQDVDLSWSLQLRGYSIHTVPTAVVYCRPWESFSVLWKKHISIGENEANLYRKYAAYGMPRSSTRAALGKYKSLIRRAFHLGRAGVHARRRWVGEAGRCWGRIRGSLRYRTLYL
jgi:glycosyltransferase involved in cell wall biosynthesis